MSDNKRNYDPIIAAVLTFVCALLILLGLFFGGLTWDREALAQASTPEISEEEPIFIETELLELGEENSETEETPAPAPEGEPELAEVDNLEKKIPEVKPEPVKSPDPQMPASTKESTVKVKQESGKDEEKKNIASTMANKFSSKNGNSDKTNDNATNGSGGSGVGVTGNANGRSFISCPAPDVALRNKTVVTVNVVIDADGNVTEATASGGGDASVRNKCVAAAKRAKWSAKKGASSTRGSITFTITPR